MLEYIFGVLILFFIWLFMYFYRKDLRRPMIWSGVFYTFFLIALFIFSWISYKFGLVSSMVIPAYWNPNTLFDLGRITGGLAIEDVFFMFFIGGISAFVYEGFFGKRIQLKRTYRPHLRAILIGMAVAALIWIFFDLNPIYAIIIFGFVGSFVLWVDRRDLIKHSLIGGFSFLAVYVIAFFLFNVLFPDFVSEFYSLNNISGIIVLKIPLEEWLYALSFGFLWAPMYEYAHGEKVR